MSVERIPEAVLDSLPDSLPAAQFEMFDDRPSWLEGRSHGIGSSDAAAILGVSRFRSPLALYHEKLGLKSQNPKTQELRSWGLVLEEPIARRYSEVTGRFIAKPPAHSLARSKQFPFAVASCDRFVIGHASESKPSPAPGLGVLEVKNAHLFMADEWSEENNNEPPVEYQIQLQHQLMVTGLPWGSIAALIGGTYFLWADRPRDEELIAVLAKREAEFWQRIIDRNPPEADGSESTKEILKRLYPKDTGEIVNLDHDAAEWLENYEAAKGDEKLAKENIELYGNKLKQAIGNGTMAVLPNGRSFTYKTQERPAFTVAATSFRVLRIGKPKK